MQFPNYERKDPKSLEIKTRIFHTALSLIKESGYDNITVRMICDKAEVSTGMFYRSFCAKEDLLSFYFDKMQGDFTIQVKNTIDAMADLEEQLIAFYAWLCNFTVDLGLDFSRQFFSGKNIGLNTELFQNCVFSVTNRYLEKAVQNGFIISDGRTPRDASKDMCVIVKGVIFDWLAHEGSCDMSEYCIGLLRRCLKSIL